MTDLHTAHQNTASDTQNGSCWLDFGPAYSISSSCVSFLLPCLIMLSIYLKLWSIGRGHVESIQAAAQLARCVDQRMSGCRLLAKVGPGGGEESETTPPVQNSALQTDHRSTVVRQASHQQQISHSLIEEHKATITVGVITGVFLLCWGPFFITNIVHGLSKDCIAPDLFKVLTWLGYSNSAFNPVIYSIFNSEFRNGFRKILFGRRRSTFYSSQ